MKKDSLYDALMAMSSQSRDTNVRVDVKVDVHEHRAPTDDSVRLAAEFAERARLDIVHQVVLTSTLGDVKIVAYRQIMGYVAYARVRLDGREVVVREEVDSSPLRDSGKLLITRLRGSLAREIALVLIEAGLDNPESKFSFDEERPMTPYHEALHKCAERYRDMQLVAGVVSTDPLWQFCMQFLMGCRDDVPVPKLCRWLGYIQGVLIERGYTTVQTERDWTRPLFRPLDFPGDVPMTEPSCDSCSDPGRCCRQFYLATRENGTAEVRTGTTRDEARRQMEAKGWPFEPLDHRPFEMDGHWIDAWTFFCTKLLPNGRCGVYEDRPQLCRDYEPGSDALCVYYGRSMEST